MPKRLLALLTTTFGLAAIIGNTIGAGILSTPGTIASLLPVPALFFAVWVIGALYALGGANAICELGTMMPRSGGQYHFSREALGPYAGFVVGWNDWISVAGSGTAVALVFAQSFTQLVPGLSGHERVVAATLIIAFTVLVWGRVTFAALAQDVTTFIKAVAFVALIVAALVYASTHDVVAAPAAPAQSTSLFLAFIVAMQSVIYSYDGWTGAIYFSEELQDPGRTIPRATFGGLIAVAILYLLINLAFVAVLPLSRLAGEPLAATAVATEIFGDRGNMIVRIIIVCSLPSFINAALPMASRVLFSMSRDGLAPAWAEQVNEGGTPTAALFMSALIALAFLFTGTVDAVISVLAFLFVATYALSFISLFVLRRREPARERPYRAKGHPWTTGAVLAGSLVFLAGSIWSDVTSGGRNALIAAALVAVSYPIYRVAVRRA